MKLNSDSKNDRKSKLKVESDAIKNRLGEKMRNLFSDAALKVKQRKKEKEEMIKLEQIPEQIHANKNTNKPINNINMITLEL